MQVELEEKVVEALALLRSQADELHLPLHVYIKGFADVGAKASASVSLTDAEFEAILDEMADGSEGLPVLPSDFSRADIYADHD